MIFHAAEALKPLPRIARIGFKVGVLGIEANSSYRIRGPTAMPYSFPYVMIISTVPHDAGYIEIEDPIGAPQVRTDQFHVTRILAPLVGDRAIECSQAFSPMSYRAYFKDYTHHSILDKDPKNRSSNGIYFCPTMNDAVTWARRVLHYKLINSIDNINAEFLTVCVPETWHV